MVVGGSRQETLEPGFLLLGTRQQGENPINEKFSQMDHSNKGDCITETPKRISRVRKASEISDSTTLYKNKPRTTSLPLNDLLTRYHIIETS
ncbi:unnamed protein product [Schistosoma margrebowiei]|uniref:Uncharacterized protein n=1 Tax=Schistosoma margrebowiei TaxID=48269 RepID=A0A183MZE8_9TREM|nr:unnamed protein product [Schistosoma margrebowiei]